MYEQEYLKSPNKWKNWLRSSSHTFLWSKACVTLACDNAIGNWYVSTVHLSESLVVKELRSISDIISNSWIFSFDILMQPDWSNSIKSAIQPKDISSNPIFTFDLIN